jgi:hypothetical protein
MDELKSSDYWITVTNYAKEALAREAEGEDRCCVISELVGNSQWKFVHYRARHVLLWSENEDAIFDEGFAEMLSAAQTMLEIYEKAAYAAMMQDVIQKAADLEDDQ